LPNRNKTVVPRGVAFMNTRHRRKRLYPADEQAKRDEYFRDIGLLKMDERRLRQKRNFELWCEGREKEMT